MKRKEQRKKKIARQAEKAKETLLNASAISAGLLQKTEADFPNESDLESYPIISLSSGSLSTLILFNSLSL